MDPDPRPMKTMTMMLINTRNRDTNVNKTALLLGKLLTHGLLILGLLLGSGAAQAVGGITSDEAAPHYATNQNREDLDRKSTRLNSSHVKISYAVFCLKKKNS